MACSSGCLSMVEALLEAGANINAVDNDGHNALMHTCLGHGDKDTINLLVQKGLDVNQRSNQGSTALHFAAGNDHVEVLNILKNKQANIQAVDNCGDTALIRACCFSGGVCTVRWLIDQGTDVTHVNNEGFTAFHYAAQNGKLDIIKLLHRSNAALLNMSTAEGYAISYASNKTKYH